jgi:hypothetical protein
MSPGQSLPPGRNFSVIHPAVLIALLVWHELASTKATIFAVVQLHHAIIALPAWLDRGLRMLIVTPFMHKGSSFAVAAGND